MDTYKVKWTLLGQEIFSLLCKRAGEKMSQREIAKILAVSPTAVGDSIKQLKNGDLIKIEKAKTVNFISFNRDGQIAMDLKRVENLKTSILRGYLIIWRKSLPVRRSYYSGAIQKGEDTNTSDIDIAVIERKDKTLDLGRYEKILNRKINVNFYDSWKKIHENLKNNILNGILLHGCVAL